MHPPMRGGGVAGGSSVRHGRKNPVVSPGSWAPSRKNLGFAGGDSAGLVPVAAGGGGGRLSLVPRAATPADSLPQLQVAGARGQALLRAPGPHRPSPLALPPRALLFRPGDPRDVLPPRPASVGELNNTQRGYCAFNVHEPLYRGRGAGGRALLGVVLPPPGLIAPRLSVCASSARALSWCCAMCAAHCATGAPWCCAMSAVPCAPAPTPA